MTTFVSGVAQLVASGHALIKEALKLLECSKHKTAPNNFPRTSLGELNQVERYLNQGSLTAVWLGSRVSYKPKRGAGGAVILHLMQNASDKLRNVLPIGDYDRRVFLIIDIGRLARVYVCAYYRARFTEAELLQTHANQQMCSRKDSYRLPKRAGRSSTDSV